MNNEQNQPAQAGQAERRVMRRLLCTLGFHKYDWRELHACEPVMNGAPFMLMAIIERCGCGESRIAPSGNEKRTMTGLAVPTKYMPHNAKN